MSESSNDKFLIFFDDRLCMITIFTVFTAWEKKSEEAEDVEKVILSSSGCTVDIFLEFLQPCVVSWFLIEVEKQINDKWS